MRVNWSMEPEKGVPLLTISGFLGSGKTTLVNRLLSQSQGRRFVVFINDFGAINIDMDLIKTVMEDRVSLKNGCVCCSLSGDFVAQVAEFARQPQPPDAFLIEASGVSDPRALDASLRALEAAELIRRDANVYLVDADQFGNLNYADTELLIDHAAVSDLILLNKADLASAERLGEIEQMLKISAPYAHLIRTRQGDVGLSLLMDQFGGAGARRLPSDAPATAAHPDFVSWSRETIRPLSRAAFDRFARRLPTSCVRAKGVLMFSDLPQRQYVFNLVGTRASLVQRELSDPSLGSRLVAIGLSDRMDNDFLDRAFDDALEE